MDEAEKNFELAVVLWGALAVGIACTGVFVWVEGSAWWGPILTFGGVVGVTYVTLHVKGLGLPGQYALLGMVILTWLLLGYDIYNRHRQQPLSAAGDIFMAYSTISGNPAHGECVATVNGTVLSNYTNDYRVALLCGISDATVDWLENRTIQISQPFSIQDGPVGIRVHFSKQMTDTLNDHLSSQATGIPDGQPATIQYLLSYQAVLLPTNGSCEPSNIQRPSDIQRCGGKLLPEGRALYGFANRQIPVGQPTPLK